MSLGRVAVTVVAPTIFKASRRSAKGPPRSSWMSAAPSEKAAAEANGIMLINAPQAEIAAINAGTRHQDSQALPGSQLNTANETAAVTTDAIGPAATSTAMRRRRFLTCSGVLAMPPPVESRMPGSENRSFHLPLCFCAENGPTLKNASRMPTARAATACPSS